MTTVNNLRLLTLSFSLLLSLHFSRPDLSPPPSPGPEPDSDPGSVPVPTPSLALSPVPSPTLESGPSPAPSAGSEPSQAPNLGWGTVSLPPAGQEPGLWPPSPGPAVSDRQAQFDSSTAPAPAADVNPKVKEICDSTDHPALCLATVVPRLDGNYDVPTVLEVSIRVGFELAKFGLSLAKTVADAPGVPSELASVLRDCKDSYDDAVYNFESTIDAFPRRDIGTMNSMLSAVITDVGDCEDGFSGFGEESPFSSVADRLTNMTSNCLAIVSLLIDGETTTIE